jgi:hypothetical protein
MIFVPPRRLPAFQKLQEPAPAQFLARSFQQKRTPAPGTNQAIDFAQKIIRNNYVRSLCACHM